MEWTEDIELIKAYLPLAKNNLRHAEDALKEAEEREDTYVASLLKKDIEYFRSRIREGERVLYQHGAQ
jgi:hypothetical protein